MQPNPTDNYVSDTRKYSLVQKNVKKIYRSLETSRKAAAKSKNKSFQYTATIIKILHYNGSAFKCIKRTFTILFQQIYTYPKKLSFQFRSTRQKMFFFTLLKMDVHCYFYYALLLKRLLKGAHLQIQKYIKYYCCLYLRTTIENCVCRSAEYQQKRDKERRRRGWDWCYQKKEFSRNVLIFVPQASVDDANAGR